MTVAISDVNICCNPIKTGCQFQACFNVISAGLLKDVYIFISDVLQVSDRFSGDDRHCYCLMAPSIASDYVVTIQAIDVATPTISDIQTQTLYVREPTCPSYFVGCTCLPFTPAAFGSVTISANLSDVLDRIFVQHQLVSCCNCCCASFEINMQSDLSTLVGFLDRSDFPDGSAERRLQQLIAGCC